MRISLGPAAASLLLTLGSTVTLAQTDAGALQPAFLVATFGPDETGDAGAGPQALTAGGADLYFKAYDLDGGRGIYRRSDGGFTQLAELGPPANAFVESFKLVPLGGRYLIQSCDQAPCQLLSTDGTREGTTVISGAPLNDMTSMVSLTEKARMPFFTAAPRAPDTSPGSPMAPPRARISSRTSRPGISPR